MSRGLASSDELRCAGVDRVLLVSVAHTQLVPSELRRIRICISLMHAPGLGQRPTASRLLESPLVQHIKTHHLAAVSADILDPHSCSLPLSMMSPFSPFRWLYDLVDQEQDYAHEEEGGDSVGEHAAATDVQWQGDGAHRGNYPRVIVLGRSCFQAELAVSRIFGRFQNTQHELAFQRAFTQGACRVCACRVCASGCCCFSQWRTTQGPICVCVCVCARVRVTTEEDATWHTQTVPRACLRSAR